MFFRRRRPSLLFLLLGLLGLGFLVRRRRHCKDEEHDDRGSRARRKFREGLDILLREDEPDQAAPAESPSQ